MKIRFLIYGLLSLLLVACSPTPQGFDDPAKVAEADAEVKAYLKKIGPKLVLMETSFVRETNRKMKGYIVIGYEGSDSEPLRVLCTVDLDTAMEKMLVLCEGQR